MSIFRSFKKFKNHKLMYVKFEKPHALILPFTECEMLQAHIPFLVKYEKVEYPINVNEHYTSNFLITLN